MGKVLLLISICLLGSFISGQVLAIAEESILPWGMESSVPRWAEAEGKSRLVRGPIFPRADSVHSYDVLFYRLNLYFPITTQELRGTALIRCRSEEDNLDSINLHLKDLTVDSVLVDGSSPSSWNHTGSELIIHFTMPFSQNDTFEVLVGYGGVPSAGYYTTGSGEFRTGYTVTPPYDSRYWFPCWDETWDKADEGCEINAEVPLGFVVASNGLLTGIDTTCYPSDTTVTYKWAESHAIATYLMSVAIAQYKQILDYYVTAGNDSVEIRHFVYGPDSSQAAVNFGETPDMVAFYVPIFGEYPFEKYGMACVANFIYAGMENQTMTTIHRNVATSGGEDIIAHELAHQWWGDMVTCIDWRDVWLNEGFATYSEAMWHEHKYGFNSFKNKMTTYGNDYLYGPFTHYPIYDPPVLFSWELVYTKGAWVLHMLRHMVGDSLYSDILHAYGQKFKYGNASTEDFRGVVDSVTNDDFNYFFQQWIYEAQHPQYEYGWQIQSLGDENYLFDLQVRQIQQYGPLFRMPVDLELSYTGGDTTFTVWVEADTFQEIEVPLTLPAGASNFSLTFDPDNWVLDQHWEVPYITVNIVSTSPVQNELNVPVGTDISVTFDVDMEESSINDSTFVVNVRSTGLSQGIVGYNSLTRTATFYPSSDFELGELVTVVLTPEIKSSQGISLKNGYNYSFTTVVDDGSGTFVSDSVYPSDSSACSIFAADLNGDGHLDLATANASSDNVSVLLNNGDGTFSPDSFYPVGDLPLSIFSADLDGDGDLDLSTSNFGSDNVSVLLNNGDGTYSPHSLYPVGTLPHTVFAADLNCDGSFDLVAANELDNNVSVLLNNGDGTFSPDSFYPVGGAPMSIFSADLDGDGDLDLATANLYYPANVSVLLNYGDGIFAHHFDYPVGDNPASIFSADLDGDGDLDLATANANSDNVSVLLNNGDGTFAPHSDYPVGDNPASIFSADLDGDGDLDLATANANSDNVSVLLNNGDGTFASHSDYPVGDNPVSIFSADLDGDGDLDLATANADSDNVSVLLNQAGITFIRGDADSNMVVGMPDAVWILKYKFIPGSPPPSCMKTGDADDDGSVGMPDAVYILRYKFIPGSPPPPAPFPECGLDPTPDELGCNAHPCMGRYTMEKEIKSVR